MRLIHKSKSITPKLDAAIVLIPIAIGVVTFIHLALVTQIDDPLAYIPAFIYSSAIYLFSFLVLAVFGVIFKIFAKRTWTNQSVDRND